MYEVANFKNIYYLQTDAFEIIRQRRMDVSAADLRGFQLKPFALAESIFNEVMLVDADVLFFERPEILWSNASYQATGTMVSDSSALSHIADLHTYNIHQMHVCIPVCMLNTYIYVLYYITHIGIQNTLLHTHTHTHSLTDSLKYLAQFFYDFITRWHAPGAHPRDLIKKLLSISPAAITDNDAYGWGNNPPLLCFSFCLKMY